MPTVGTARRADERDDPMPRISAPSVAEHRAAQERMLLDAAHAILRETGEAPTMAQLAERAGLARSSVYEYFGSRREVLSALVRDIFPRWTERIGEAMRAAASPAEAIVAYACANVELVAEGSHAAGEALSALEPGAETDEQAARMHAQIQEPLIATLTELGLESPESVAEMINAVVYAGIRMLEAGQSMEQVTGHLRVVLGPLGTHGAGRRS
jgi:AcrR family transcriptional regulator